MFLYENHMRYSFPLGESVNSTVSSSEPPNPIVSLGEPLNFPFSKVEPANPRDTLAERMNPSPAHVDHWTFLDLSVNRWTFSFSGSQTVYAEPVHWQQRTSECWRSGVVTEVLEARPMLKYTRLMPKHTRIMPPHHTRPMPHYIGPMLPYNFFSLHACPSFCPVSLSLSFSHRPCNSFINWLVYEMISHYQSLITPTIIILN